MGSTAHLDVSDSYISYRSARASSIRSLNLQVPEPKPIPRSLSFRSTIRTRSWTLKKQKSLASFVYNVVVLGSGGVGKTSIIQHYVKGTFPERHVTTLADVYEKNIHRISDQDDSVYCLRIYDTAGTFSFPAMTRLTIRNGDGYFLVYSLDDRSSFEQIKKLHEEILEIKNTSYVPLLLVANKSDLPERHRQISRQEGMKLAKQWGVNFAEISGRSQVNTEEIFRILFDEFDTNLTAAVPISKSKLHLGNDRLHKKQLHEKRKPCSIM